MFGRFSILFARTLASVSACLLCFLMCPDAAHGQNFEIGKISVCYNALSQKSSPCSEATSPFVNLDRRKFSSNRVYVSLTLFCGPEAVAYLKANGFLPVNVGVWKDGLRRKGDIPIGILQDDWDTNGDALTQVFNNQGSFSWRTRFNVSLVGVQSVKLEIVDAQQALAYVGKEPARLEISFSN